MRVVLFILGMVRTKVCEDWGGRSNYENVHVFRWSYEWVSKPPPPKKKKKKKIFTFWMQYKNTECNTSNWLSSNVEVLTGGHSSILHDYILNPGSEGSNIGEDSMVLWKVALLHFVNTKIIKLSNHLPARCIWVQVVGLRFRWGCVIHSDLL